MKKFAAVFPGQGSQFVGMFASFMEDPIVNATYDEAGEALGYDLRSLTLNGPEEELNRTEITQPAILTASVAAFRALREKAGDPACVAGHSLGEYSALVAAGVLEFKDAVRLVRLRGQAMQEAVPAGRGAMAAVLGLDDQVIIDNCKMAAEESGHGVWAANFNTPGQVVISGSSEGVKKASELLAQAGARRVVPLAVSAPSHCPLMQSAADRLQEALKEIKVCDAKIPVYSNAYAKPESAAEEIVKALVLQLTGPVRWAQTVTEMKKAGVEVLVETGPNKVLSGMVRRIDKTLGAANVCDPESLSKTLEILN